MSRGDREALLEWYNSKDMKGVYFSVALVVIVALLGGGVFYVWPETREKFFPDESLLSGKVTAKYESGNPSVRVQNAKLVAKEQYTLAFPFSGRIESIIGIEGQLVTNASQPIVQMETTEWKLELKKAEASYHEGQAIVKKLEQGARFEELLILEQKKQSSESALKGSKKEVIDTITHAFTLANDAIYAKTDSIYSTPDTNPTLTFTPATSGLKERLESEREDMGDLLDDWKDDVDDMKSSGNVTKYVTETRKKLSDVREYLDLVGEAVNVLAAGSITQETIDAWKESLSAARSAVAEATIAFGGTESAYQVATKGVAVAKGELDYRLAGTQKQDIEAALSVAAAAKSQMDIIQEKLKQTTLVTPLPGLFIKKIIPRIGEYVQAGQPVALLVDPIVEVEADIPEEKIVGITAGNKAILRLNAYTDRDFHGTVSRIEPQEIEKGGGVYFRARVTLEDIPGDLLRMGMMGDVVIATTLQGGVVRIPVQLVSMQNGRRVVRVFENGSEESRVIETGIESDGMIEVLSGLQAGDELLSPSVQ